MNFDEIIEQAKIAISDCVKEFEPAAITIIRDAMGKISYFIEADIAQEQMTKMHVRLEQQLGNFFSGAIFLCSEKNSDFTQALIDEVKKTRLLMAQPESDDLETTWYLLEKTISKKAWLFPAQPVKPVWEKERADKGEMPKVVSFYSFKGGMGRTTALAATALCLCEKGKRVLVVDTDVEAPGVGTLFLPDTVGKKGVLDYFVTVPITDAVNFEEYISTISDSELTKDGTLYIMTAGNVDENYLQKLARVDYQDNRPNFLADTLRKMLNSIAQQVQNIDYILVDCRAGFHDMGGVALTQLPHLSVLFGNGSRQSWQGLKQAISVVAQAQQEPLPTVMVNTMCKNSTDSGFAQQETMFKRKAHEIFAEKYYPYLEDSLEPGIDATGEPHTPVCIWFQDSLQNDIQLFDTGEEGGAKRASNFASILKEEPYKTLSKRIQEVFGED